METSMCRQINLMTPGTQKQIVARQEDPLLSFKQENKMAAVFGVAEFAATTRSSKSAAEATSRALSLYRKFQKSVLILASIAFIELSLLTKATS